MINDISICKFYENLIDAIDLGNFFINFLWENKKTINFFDIVSCGNTIYLSALEAGHRHA